MVELLKQPQYEPYPIDEQIVSIFAGTKGFLDDLPVAGCPSSKPVCCSTFATRTRRSWRS